MEAPDKIFILYHKDFSDRRIFNAFTEKEDETDIEYIRKDALLEWAKEEGEGNVGATYKVAMRNLIQKLDSM